MTPYVAAHLRPLTMGQILDRALRLYRRNFLRFLGLAALIQIPATLLGLLPAALNVNNPFLQPNVDPTQIDFTLVGVLVLVGFVVVSVTLIWSQIGAAALNQMAVDTYLEIPTGIIPAFRAIGRSWLTLLGALLWAGLLSFLLVIAFIIPCIGWLGAVPGAGVLMYGSLVIFPLIAPVVVLERSGARRAWRRAWDLARQRFWWLFGFFVLLTGFSFLIVQGPLYVVLFLSGAVLGETLDPALAAALQVVISGLFGVIYYPVQTTSVALAYLDSRIRLEGLDLALQAAEGQEVTAAQILQQTPPLQEQRLVQGKEWGYFILITLIAGVIYGLFIGLVMALGLTAFSQFG